MAHQRSYQTHLRTYNPFTNSIIGGTSQYAKSTATRIVVDNDGHKIHLGKTSYASHHQQVKHRPHIMDARSIIVAKRDNSNTKRKSENTNIRIRSLEQEINHASDDAKKEASEARRREIVRLRNEEIQRKIKELEDREQKLANEQRRLRGNLDGGTPPRGRSRKQRSPSGNRSPKRRKSRSRDRHHKVIERPHEGSLPRGDNSPCDNDHRSNYRRYIGGHINIRRNNKIGHESNNNDEYEDDDDYHRRHDDYYIGDNDDDHKKNMYDDEGKGNNNNKHDEATILRMQLEKMERKSRQTYAEQRKTIQSLEHGRN